MQFTPARAWAVAAKSRSSAGSTATERGASCWSAREKRAQPAGLCRDGGRRQPFRCVEMLLEIVLVQTPVVVEVVAAGVLAGRELEAGVARPLARDVGVARPAVVDGLGHAHRARQLRPVLDVTGHAAARVELRHAFGVARVGELAGWMRVVDTLELLGVTVHTRFRLHAQHRRVAQLALALDRMMAGAHRAGHDEAAIALEHAIREVSARSDRQRREQRPHHPPRRHPSCASLQK
jgi:hypothetical protein